MSNIYTSYIRIYRRDGGPLSQNEMEHLFQLAVQAYDGFGSYWVRILKKYRPLENCLDIQFGSGKRYHSGNLLEEYEVFNKYFVWERFSIDGGYNDQIFTLKENPDQKWIETDDFGPCLYRFDRVRITCNELPAYFAPYDLKQLYSTEYEILMCGTYYACNSRSLMDLFEDSEFYGPNLEYDPHYASDYFVPSPNGYPTESDSDLIKDLFMDPHKELAPRVKVELYWNYRLVQVVENNGDEVLSHAADYWDNCGDPAYLAFVEELTKINPPSSK